MTAPENQPSSAASDRYRIDGTRIVNPIQGDRCFECGMGLCDPREYHPWEACEEFGRSHDSRKVWRLLRPMLALELEAARAR